MKKVGFLASLSLGIIITIFLVVTGEISFDSKNSKIAQNVNMQGMFKQAQMSKEDRKEAEESFVARYFDIHFD